MSFCEVCDEECKTVRSAEVIRACRESAMLRLQTSGRKRPHRPPLSMTTCEVFLGYQLNKPTLHSFSTTISFRYIQPSGFQPHNSSGQLCLHP